MLLEFKPLMGGGVGCCCCLINLFKFFPNFFLLEEEELGVAEAGVGAVLGLTKGGVLVLVPVLMVVVGGNGFGNGGLRDLRLFILRIPVRIKEGNKRTREREWVGVLCWC